MIKNKSTGKLLSVNGSKITTVSTNSGSAQRWRVGYTPCYEIDIEDIVATPGETIFYSDLDITFNDGASTPTNVTSTSIYNVSASPSGSVSFATSGMTISSDFPGGEITVTFGRKDTTATAVFSVFVSEFPGTYFIKSVESNLYMNCKTNNNGDYAIQTDQVQRWQFEIQTDGYYLIRNLPSNRYLKVAGDSSASGQNIKLYEFEFDSNNNRIITDGFKFKVETSVYGNKIIIPKTGENNDYVLAFLPMFHMNGLQIQQLEYIQDSNYDDEWNFVEFSYSDYNYKFVAIDEYITDEASYGVDSRDDYFKPVTEIIKNNTAGEVFSEYTVGITDADFESMLETSEVFLIHTHGMPRSILLDDGNAYSTADLNNADLSNVKLAVIMTCHSADIIYSNSFILQMVGSGAQTVIGFQSVAVDSDPTDGIGRGSVANVDCNQFAEELFDLLLNEEKTVDQAIDYIRTVSRGGLFDLYKPYYDDDFLDKIVVVGDGELTLQ